MQPLATKSTHRPIQPFPSDARVKSMALNRAQGDKSVNFETLKGLCMAAQLYHSIRARGNSQVRQGSLTFQHKVIGPSEKLCSGSLGRVACCIHPLMLVLARFLNIPETCFSRYTLSRPCWLPYTAYEHHLKWR